MNYRRIVTLLLVLLAGTCTYAQSLDTLSNLRTKPLGRLSKNHLIDELYHQIDSLQKAYDSLYVEYQSVIQPVNVVDDEDIIPENDVNDTTAFAADYTPENIDSLLHAFYIQMDKQLTSFDFESMDRDTLTSSIPDSVYIARLNKINSFIPLQFNRYVKNDIIHYTEKIPNTTARILGLAPYKKHFPGMSFETVITRNVRLSEAPSYGKPAILYDASSSGANNYLALAQEIINKNN